MCLLEDITKTRTCNLICLRLQRNYFSFRGNYIACLQQLNKLDSRNNDYKVVHNKAVAEYYKSDLKKTDQFKKALHGVFVQARMRPEIIDDVEQCVAQYNLAVLLYHQQQYASSLKIVNRLLSFVEPMGNYFWSSGRVDDV